ncbi:MAG: hypothetical protein QGH73_05590 [Rhodospirillales bacterium]|jgi:hypothetical protein|nr:hypothetical protein [Rhodospirillaceae bacterium]MDP6429207.1 hypothetical protein [Rhodospirillales bacterium]MDP6644078.1 hypothetical protein [Rhodospirillales bacterium]MDP6841130.1 hypothetical protein [Rhodospirillales bacterium]|tara:strand:+ start:3728 stop:3955 length:228 start_codon:yes stop_codon:yes gene_type:complete
MRNILARVFLGKPLYWALWIVVLAVFYTLGSLSLHARSFNLFLFILLGLSAFAVAVIVFTYKKGERVTRDPFDAE